VQRLTETDGFAAAELDAVDERVRTEVDDATEIAERSPPPEALDALGGVYADPAVMPALWYREGVRSAVEPHERPAAGERSMAEVTFLEAIRAGLFEEMERDPNVFCMGEDIGRTAARSR
jgi:hypothetical protein